MPSPGIASSPRSYAQEISDAQDKDRMIDVEKAASDVQSAEYRRKSPVAQMQKMAKAFAKWDRPFKRPSKKAARALQQLASVPLTPENVSWGYESSLRLAFQEAIQEEAQGDNPDNEPDISEQEHRVNQAVRAAFLAAIRIDADEQDVQRVMRAVQTMENEKPAKVRSTLDSDSPHPYRSAED